MGSSTVSAVHNAAAAVAANNNNNNMDSFAQWCGDLAPWAAIVVFLAPIPTMQRIAREKTVGNLPLLPYSAMICSTSLWCVYGLLKDEVRIWSANLFGLIMSLYFFARFVRFSPKASSTLPGSVHRHMQFIFVMVLSTCMIATTFTNVELALSIIGMGGVIFAFSMFASPLSVLKLVLEKKSAKAIPLPFTVASLINCLLWGIFGLFGIKDVNIYLPNVLGLLCTLAQLALKLKYGDGTTGPTELPA